MVYSIISGICIAAMVSLVIYLIVMFCNCNRAEKIEFIKNFKKGKCAIIYVVAIPLFMMADLHAGKSVIVSIFSTIPKVVDLVVLKYSIPHALIAENICFSVAVYLCMTLVLINALMIPVSILHAYFWKNYRLFRFTHLKKNKYIIIGNNETTVEIYRSCHAGSALVIDSMSKEEQEKLYIKGVSYQALRQKRLNDWLEKTLKKAMKRLAKVGAKVNIVVNCEQEQDNLSWCEAFLRFINDTGDAVADRIEIYVFGNREFEDIYSKFEENSKGCLHYINEYQQIAVDFIDRFPLTEYMTEKHIDYKTSLLKPETEINVAMIGFGRTNQQIFLSMVANNQFLTKDSDGNIVEKRVKYHLFDRLHASGHKNLNHNYFRYRYDFVEDGNVKVDENEYLPLPQFPAQEEYHYLDINAPTFYRELEGVL